MLRTNIFRQAAPGGCADYAQKQAQATIFARFAWTLVAALTALIVANTHSPARAAEGVTERAEMERRAVRRAATIAEIKSNPYDKDILVRLAVIKDEIDSGTPASDILDKVNAASYEFNSRFTGYEDDREGKLGYVAPLLKAVFGTGLAALTKDWRGPGLALVSSGIADIAGNLKRDHAVPREVRRKTTYMKYHTAVENVVDGVYESFNSLDENDQREIDRNWDSLVPTMNPQLTPLQSADRLISESPVLARHKEVLDLVRDSQQDTARKILEATKFISSRLKELDEETSGNLQTISDRLSVHIGVEEFRWDVMEQRAHAREVRERARETARRNEQIRRIEVEGIRAAGYIVTTLVGIADQDTGTQLAATFEAGFDVYDAVDTFLKVQREFDGLTSFAVAALTGNILSAGLKLVSAFVDTGPTADELILEGIGKLGDQIKDVRQQIEDVRQQMHGRFDRIESQLEVMYIDLTEGIAQLEEYVRRRDAQVLGELEAIRRTLSGHERKMEKLARVALVQADRVIGRLEAGDIGACLQYKGAGLSSIQKSQFEDCLTKFHARATVLMDDQLTIDAFLAMGDQSRDSSDIGLLTNAAFHGFARISNDASLPTPIVSPSTWFSLADRTDRFMLDWAEHAKSFTNRQTEYGKTMNRLRENLRSYVRALEVDYRKFRIGNSSAIGKLFGDLRDDSRVLRWREYEEEQPRSDRWPGREEEYVRSQQRTAEGSDRPYRFDYHGKFIGGVLDRRTDIRDCIAYEKGGNDREEEGECRRDGNSLSEVTRSSSWGKDSVKNEIWEAFQRGFEKNTALSGMGAVGLIDHIDIYYGGVLGGDGSNQQDWDENDDRLDYKHRKEVEINAVIQASCFEDGYRSYRGRRRAVVEFDLHIGPLFSWLGHEGSFTAEEWRSKFYKANERGPLIDVDPELKDLEADFNKYFDQALRDLREDVSEDHGEIDDCGGSIERGMEAAYQQLSKEIYSRMEEDEDFRSYRVLTQKYSIYLQSWLSIMLRDMTEHSRIAEAVVEGGLVLPTLDEVWKAVKAEGGYAWDLLGRYNETLDEFEKIILTQSFEDVVNEGAGDLDLMQTLFVGIDDANPNGP